jgi:hypothetical protein
MTQWYVFETATGVIAAMRPSFEGTMSFVQGFIGHRLNVHWREVSVAPAAPEMFGVRASREWSVSSGPGGSGNLGTVRVYDVC